MKIGEKKVFESVENRSGSTWKVRCPECGINWLVFSTTRGSAFLPKRTCRCGAVFSMERLSDGEGTTPNFEVTLIEAGVTSAEVETESPETAPEVPEGWRIVSPIALEAPVFVGKEDAHPAFEDTMIGLSASRNALLSGPSGTGKTYLGKTIAAVLKRPFYVLGCNETMSVTKLEGYVNPVSNEYFEAPPVKLYREGGVLLVDEFDAMDGNTMVRFNNMAAEDGTWDLPNGETIERHPDFVLIATANTWGSGPTAEYVRGKLDLATIDRFAGSMIFVDYNRDLEARFAEDGDLGEVAEAFWKIRRNLVDSDTRRVLTTRAFKRAATIRKNYPEMSDHDLMMRFVHHWTPTERDKALFDVKLSKAKRIPGRKPRSAGAEVLARVVAEPEVEHEELGAVTEPGNGKCVKCGSPRVKRIATKGPFKGDTFLGCSRFPKCHAKPVPVS